MPLAAAGPTISRHIDVHRPLVQQRRQNGPDKGSGNPQQQHLQDQATGLHQQIQGNGQLSRYGKIGNAHHQHHQARGNDQQTTTGVLGRLQGQLPPAGPIDQHE